MLYFICAGEASGDLHASALIRALRAGDAQARFCFLGGDMMAEAAGTAPVIHIRDMAYMGFTDVVRHLPEIRRNLDIALRLIVRLKPDAVILVDYPSFNLKLTRRAWQEGIPAYYYISPKVWAWKEYRVREIRRYCRRVLSILPFEVPFYRRHGMEVDYVGNPSVEEIDAMLPTLEPRAEFLARHGLPDRPIIAIVPGSRRGEIADNAAVMLEAARVLERKYQLVVAGAPAIAPDVYRQLTHHPVVSGATHALMRHAAVALVTSGTATLECALIGTPQIVCYRANGSRISYELMRRVLSVDHVSLPNLIAGATVVPEMLLHNCRPLTVLGRLLPILPGHPGREAQLAGYRLMREKLGRRPAAPTAARIIIDDLLSIGQKQ